MHLWVQEMPENIDVHTDSDWAGCKRTRISVSGGVVRIGGAPIKCWSKDQHNLAKSSAEAELYAANLGGEQALGIQTMMRELGCEMSIRIYIDSSAALGVIQRKGIGKIRHLEVADLWLQKAVREDRMRIHKIDGILNDADLFTKPLTAQGISIIMERLWNEYT